MIKPSFDDDHTNAYANNHPNILVSRAGWSPLATKDKIPILLVFLLIQNGSKLTRSRSGVILKPKINTIGPTESILVLIFASSRR